MLHNTKNMNWNEKSGVAFLTFPSFEKIPFLKHAFSTRIGGVSKNEFASMNLNFGRGDPDENVLKNYHLFCDAAGFDFHSLVASAQDHHTFVRRVTQAEAGVGIWRPKDQKSVDALITNVPSVTLVIYSADCVPLLFCDPVNHAIGAAHAGWRGTAAKIAKITVDAMSREFGSDPKNLIAVIGPSIGPECYEVDAPVAEQFDAMCSLSPEKFLCSRGGGKYLLNLWEVNRRVMLEAGIPETNITIGGVCTQCNADWLFSHRASGGKRGGLAAFLCIKEGTE